MTTLRRFPSAAAAALAITAQAGAQHHLFTVEDGGMDTRVRCHADTDGDGLPEVQIASQRFRASLVVRSGRTARTLHTVPEDPFKRAIELVDLDGDGTDDLLWKTHGSYGIGDLIVAPGGTSSRITSWRAPTTGTEVIVDDIDGDGVRDVLIGNTFGTGHQSGTVEARSGANGSVIVALTPTQPGLEYGREVAVLGDLDHDGSIEIAVASRGAAEIRSLPGGGLYAALGQPNLAIDWGIAVARVDDVNGDGVADVAVGGPGHSLAGGLVAVFSGRDGTELLRWSGQPGDYFGAAVTGVGDADGDGIGDLVIGVPQIHRFGGGTTGPGFAVVASTATRGELARLTGDPSATGFGFRLYALDDLDGDGAADFALGEFSSSTVRFFSARPQTATADRLLVPANSGAEQRLALHGDPVHAGAGFLVLGSASGTRPGFALGGHHVPLQPDGYFSALLDPTGLQLLVPAFGKLSADGTAQTRFRVPAIPGLDPAVLTGLTLDHAFLVFDPGTLQVLATSRAVPVTIGE